MRIRENQSQKSYLASYSNFLADKTHKTKGLVLRTVKYGETSVISTVYTELFGLQSYIVNGIRKASKNGSNKAAFFQPAVLLDMEVHHNGLKQLNRIKEYRLAYIHEGLFSDVLRNGIAQYMVELLTKCLREPENNAELFAFLEDSLNHLNSCNQAIMANFPVFYAVHLSNFFGFFPGTGTEKNLQEDNMIFDLQEGCFTSQMPAHNLYLGQKPASLLAELSRVRQPPELAEIRTNAETRRKILEALETYYALHIQDFGRLKTLTVLRELMR